MPGPVAGMFFYLYLIVDIFSRKIVGWEVHERESADLGGDTHPPCGLGRRLHLAATGPARRQRQPPSHACSACIAGQRMKGATMKATLEKLSIIASCSRPRVSNDNPFSEALFRTCKYRPDWPSTGFATKAEAQA